MRYRSTSPIPLLLLALAAVPAVADEPAAPNVLVTFEVGEVRDGRDAPLKTYEMIVAADGHRVAMSTGARIPIPTTQFKVAEDGSVPAPVTSFTYQQVGFSATVMATLDDGGIRLRGSVDDSSLADLPAEHGRPFIQSMDQNLSVLLRPGVPLRINRVDESETRSFYISVRADRLDERGERVAAR